MKKSILTLIILWSGLISFAQQPLSLANAIEKALKNNYDIQIVKNAQQKAEINNNWGTAGRYPYIQLSANDDNAFNANQTENYTSNRFYGGASVSWTLFDGYAVRINKQRFGELEELSKQNTAIMVESTIQSVILAYYDVLLQQEKLKTFDEIMQLSEARYRQAESRREYGVEVTYNVLQAQNAYLEDRADYLLQQVAVKNAFRDLQYLMAEKEAAEYVLTEKFAAIAEEYQLGNLEAQMMENNRSLQNQYINQRLLENAVASAKSAFSPSLDFRGGVTGTAALTNYASRGGSWANTANFYGNFTLSYNLFSGGNRKRAVQLAAIEQETEMVKIEEMQHDLKNRLANIFEFYQVEKELLDVARENLAAARLNLQISREKFDSGAINSFNFRDVQNIYLNASIRELQAIYNFIDTHTSLLRMTGTIIQEYE